MFSWCVVDRMLSERKRTTARRTLRTIPALVYNRAYQFDETLKETL